MFGYVRVFAPELKMKEWDQYRGIYCSLCRELGRRYGLPARMVLSYDLTLLAMFHMALSPTHAGFSNGRCSFNPAKKCMVCHEREPLAFAADTAVLLTYYKIRDNIADSRPWHRVWLYPLLWAATPMKRRAGKLRPALAEKVAAYAAAQKAVEHSDTLSVDAAAAPTAELMAWLCEGGEGEELATRRRFGYCLGRWVYLIDAADDFEDDRKRGSFNPFLPNEQGGAPTEYMRQTLNLCLSECLTAYHLLNRYRFDEILQNILQFGMPAAARQVLNHTHKKGKNNHDRSL